MRGLIELRYVPHWFARGNNRHLESVSRVQAGMAGNRKLNNLFKNLAIWMVIGVVLMTVFNQFNTRQTPASTMEYSSSWRRKAGRIAARDRHGPVLKATTGQEGRTITVGNTPGVQDIWMISDLMRYGVQINASKARGGAVLPRQRIRVVVPDAAADRRLDLLHAPDAGRGGRARSPSARAKARMLDESANNRSPSPTLPACDEAKEEVAELVEFLRTRPSSRSSAAAFRAAC